MRGLAWGLVLATVAGAAQGRDAPQEPVAAWCGYTLLAERFGTEVEPPPRGIVTYSVVLRNTLAQERSFVLVVTAPLFHRPSGAPQLIAAGGELTVELGYQAWQPGVVPLRGDRLAQVTRISCRPAG